MPREEREKKTKFPGPAFHFVLVTYYVMFLLQPGFATIQRRLSHTLFLQKVMAVRHTWKCGSICTLYQTFLLSCQIQSRTMLLCLFIVGGCPGFGGWHLNRSNIYHLQVEAVGAWVQSNAGFLSYDDWQQSWKLHHQSGSPDPRQTDKDVLFKEEINVSAIESFVISTLPGLYSHGDHLALQKY